jgi:hypothetical protein
LKSTKHFSKENEKVDTYSTSPALFVNLESNTNTTQIEHNHNSNNDNDQQLFLMDGDNGLGSGMGMGMGMGLDGEAYGLYPTSVDIDNEIATGNKQRKANRRYHYYEDDQGDNDKKGI